MDLITVREVRVPRGRDELVFAAGECPLGGGTWLYSEPQPELTGLIDLMGLGWQPLEVSDAGLTIAATCTIAELLAFTPPAEWIAWPLVAQCAHSLLASFKIFNLATVGGNIALSLPAGAMTSLLVGLDGSAVLWSASSERTVPVVDFVTGNRTNVLEEGEVVRSLHIPTAALTARTGFRRIALSPLGRTGALVTARQASDGLVFGVSGGTLRPHVGIGGIDGIDDWFDDAHGSVDWRRAMSLRFVVELTQELS